MNNSVQIPLNIGDEGGDQPQPYSPRTMETNEQPDSPPPNLVANEELPESPSPSPPPPGPPSSLQSRNPTPSPPGEEEIMVYNIPLPDQVVSIRLPRSVGPPQVEVIYRGDRVRDGLRLLHLIIPKIMLMTNLIIHSENCPHELFPKLYSIRLIARQLEVIIPTLIVSVNLNDKNAYILARNAYDQLQKMFIKLNTSITNIYRESTGMN